MPFLQNSLFCWVFQRINPAEIIFWQSHICLHRKFENCDFFGLAPRIFLCIITISQNPKSTQDMHNLLDSMQNGENKNILENLYTRMMLRWSPRSRKLAIYFCKWALHFSKWALYISADELCISANEPCHGMRANEPVVSANEPCIRNLKCQRAVFHFRKSDLHFCKWALYFCTWAVCFRICKWAL